MFGELVPVAVHQAMAAYNVRKSEVQNTEISKLRESTQLLNRYEFVTRLSARQFIKNYSCSVLASLNLPAAIEVTTGDSSLPPSIIQKADIVKELGGISSAESLIRELPDLLKRNQDILNEVSRDYTPNFTFY